MFLKMTIKPLKVTGCEEFPEGNFLNWENTNWFLNSSRGTVELSKLSFDAFYYHLYPFYLKMFPHPYLGSRKGQKTSRKNLWLKQL